MSPLLSVVVPCYRVEKYLPACLDSLIYQSLTDLEIIVVIDGPSDRSGAIATSYAELDDRVQVVFIEHSGLGAARNAGVEYATGRYLCFVDSDDLVPPLAFEQLVTTLEETSSDIAAGNVWQFSGPGDLRPSWNHKHLFAKQILKTDISNCPELGKDRMIWNKVFRREFYLRLGLSFPSIRYEDYPVTLAAYLEAKSVDVIDSYVYMWRQRIEHNSITQQVADVGNARDRVVSAEQVLGLISDQRGSALWSAVNSYLTNVDLVALGAALARSGSEKSEEAWRLMRRLAKQLSPEQSRCRAAAFLLYQAVDADAPGASRAIAALLNGGTITRFVFAILRPDLLKVWRFLAAFILRKMKSTLTSLRCISTISK